LAAAFHQSFERLGLRVRQRSHLGFDRFAKSSQHLRVERVGLGQLPGGAREVAHLPWVNHRHPDSGRREGTGDGNFQAAGRFDNHHVHESGRGFRLGKAKGSDRVDPIIALAMAVLMAGREESVGGRCEVFDFWSGEHMAPNAGGIDGMRGLPLVRQRPPDFKPMARPETEADPDAPVHPGATIWDFIDARGLDPNDPTVDDAYAWALGDYRKAMVAYLAKKAAKTSAFADADDAAELVQS
jgi:hypothetical protein